MSDPANEQQVFALMDSVVALHRALHDVGESVAAAAGLTHTRLSCLRAVAEQPQTVAAAASRLGVARQGVQRTADGLVADGLARWVDDPRHRRAKLLSPTAKGRRALAQAANAHVAWVTRAASHLPDDLPDLTVRLHDVRDAIRHDTTLGLSSTAPWRHG